MNFAATVVHVEVGRYGLIFRLELDWAGGLAVKFQQLELVGLGRTGNRAEVLLHVVERSEQPLFFTCPQANTDSTTWLDLKRIQDAHHFHRNHSTGTIVRGAST